jgi:hypothetical protein
LDKVRVLVAIIRIANELTVTVLEACAMAAQVRGNPGSVGAAAAAAIKRNQNLLRAAGDP